tara:strand:- start:551 stop:1162 length:612 start_codon:yes stop_codon:yes gene_type:complete
MASIADQFKGLPIGTLIAEPLLGAAKAQGQLAHTTEQFIKDIGLEDDGNGKLSARTVEFDYDAPVESKAADGTITTTIENRKMKVPLLSIIQTPNLGVKRATVDFDMEVKSSTQDTSSVNTKTDLSVKYDNWWSPVKVNLNASVSTKSENIRKTDNSAKYTVHVEARDDGAPEGLMKVLDILGAAIQPVPASSGGGGGGGGNK